MEPQHPYAAAIAAFSTIMTTAFGFIAWISRQDAQGAASLIASGIAILSGVMAIRYYWYATKEKKQNLKP